ncbi:hypothetical protein AAMO2058_000615400 [Amorphochlora amoebiformis]
MLESKGDIDVFYSTSNDDEKAEEPPGAKNPFLQQRFPCVCKPLHMPEYLAGAYLLYGLLAIAIGSLAFVASHEVTLLQKEYTSVQQSGGIVRFESSHTIRPPIFVYYEIKNMYSNHRAFVKSVSAFQLRGKDVSDYTLTNECYPAKTNPESDLIIYPCGTIASSQFNDTFIGYHCVNGASLPSSNCSLLTGENWHEEGIAWPTDRERYKNRALKEGESKTGYFDYNLSAVDDEQFIAWMRPGTGSTVRKLYRIIQNLALEPGDTIEITIENLYQVSTFDGKKSIVLSTTTSMGGKNYFPGYFGALIGSIFCILSLLLFYKTNNDPRPRGDLRIFVTEEARTSIQLHSSNVADAAAMDSRSKSTGANHISADMIQAEEAMSQNWMSTSNILTSVYLSPNVEYNSRLRSDKGPKAASSIRDAREPSATGL